MLARTLAASLACALFNASLRAQVDSHPPDLEPRAHTLDWLDGELWAGSPTYKARFDGGSVEFTPTLGRRAPKNYPLQWTLTSIRRGASTVHVADGDAPPRIASDRVQIARGRDIVECYEVRDHEVEQSFVFTRPLTGTGDLIVRLRIETELDAERCEGMAELPFTRGDLGGVHVGAVVGVDARGRRAAGHINYDGTHLELVLPGAFVASASYPLVLDPPIGSRFSGGASFSDYRPDIAYDATGDWYLMVWEIHRSATDIDIWGNRFKSSLLGQGRKGVFVHRGQGIQRRPRIASINASDAFLVVWEDNSRGNWDINCRAVAAGTLALSGLVQIASTAADEITPDLAGEMTTADDDAVCVWDDEAIGIRAAEVEVKSLTAVTVGKSVIVAAGAKPLRNTPAISKSGGPTRRAVIVWDDSPQILSAQAWTMDLLAASTAFGFPLTHADPEVDGDGTDFAIVFERPETATSKSNDIWCWGVSVPAAANQPIRTRAAPRRLAATSNRNERQPTITFAGTRYIAAWAAQQQNSSVDYVVHTNNLSLHDCLRCGSQFRHGDVNARLSAWPAFASAWSGGVTTSDGAWLTWEMSEHTRPVSLCFTRPYDAVVGGPVQSIAAGCGRGGALSVSGAFAFGDRVTVRLAGAAAGATASVLQLGFPGQRRQVPCGLCSFLVGPIAFGLPIRNGTTQFAFDIPCNTFFDNVTVDMQIWVVPAGATPCGTYPGLGASNILRGTIKD